MTKEEILLQLLNIYKIQAVDLSIMYKIEFGDDVLAEIKRLQDMLMEMGETEEWDVTLMDGLENEPPYVSDDFQIDSDGAYEYGIVDQIMGKITTHIRATSREPNMILVHPATFYKLVYEFKRYVTFDPTSNFSDVRFRGIKVYKSTDVLEGDTLVG
jgi:hypothetical protein